MKPPRLTFLISLCLFAVSFRPGTLMAQPAHDALKELHSRRSLPNFFSKLSRGDSVKIVYFGGSITAAAGGWRDQSAAWIQEQFPEARVAQVNASIGGTGSDLGVFRLQNDVLAHRPDLVFVEFAVNDHSTPPERISKTMEGIVRQIWRADRATDICFVYTLTATSAPTLVEGKLTPAMTAMEKIADHYGIPSVQLGLGVVDLFKQGKLIFKGIPDEHPDKVVFSNDNVHPYPQTGHRLYTEALARALPALRSQAGAPGKHQLVKPLSKDNWEHAQMLPATRFSRKGNWTLLSASSDSVARQFKNRLPELLRSDSPVASIAISFSGHLVGFYDIAGPGCGQYEVSIDGEAPKPYPRFDRYCTYYRTHYFFLPEMKSGPHTITFTVSGEKLDKMEILRQGTSKPGDMAKYEPNAVYAGYVLLLGKPKQDR